MNRIVGGESVPKKSVPWADVRKFFEPDGSLRDVYIADTTIQDWQALLDLVRTRGWWFQYFENNQPTRLPARVRTVFEDPDVCGLLVIKPIPEIRVNAHFFSEDEIELDLSPNEVWGQRRLDVVSEFLCAVGRQLDKSVALTAENERRWPIFRYDRDVDRIVIIGAR